MPPAPISLVDRAGLDRPRLAKLIARGLEGADDGELFLEYRQSEMLVFDNGRLKQATYDTAQGFGLRAVKDEAVGYAHASDVSEAAIARAAEAVRAVKGGYSGHYAEPPARTNVRSTATKTRSARPPSKPRCSCWRPSTPMRAPRTRACGRCRSRFGAILAGGRDRARRRRDLSRRAPAGAGQCLGRRRRRRPAGIRQLRLWRPRGLRALHRRRTTGSTRSTRRCARRWSTSKRCRRRPARWTWCSAPAGRASCCTRRSATGSKAISTARRPPPSPA